MSTAQAKTGNAALTHAKVGLSRDAALRFYELMALARTLDQRWWQLNRQGKASIVASSQGHEAAQFGALAAFDLERDLFFVFYRQMAGMLALGLTPKDLLLSFLAKKGDLLSGGRQFPLHGAIPERRIFNLSNVVSAQFPKAVGAALAVQMRGEKAVVYCASGDGATSEGEWHEALNFAGIHKLPIVFVCENNHYAISVPQRMQMAVERVSDRAAAYGFPGVSVDGADLFAVYQAAKEAVRRARAGEGPTLIEANVERLMAHTSDDDDRRYRSPEELQAMRKRDPVVKYREHLMAQGLLTEAQDKEVLRRAQEQVDAATEEADKAPYPDAATLLDHVYGGAAGGGDGHGR